MQDLKVSLLQCDQVWEDKTANFKQYERMLSGIEDSDLILLPEMFQTGFTMNVSLGETWEESMSLEWLKLQAKEKNAAIYTSLMIEDNGKTYNRGVFVTPESKVYVYNKRKCFSMAGEDKVITAGTENTVVNWRGWNIQLHICYDLRFPEIIRNQISANHSVLYDVLLFVANWPNKRSEHWSTLLKARAIENQSYVLGLNRIGKDKNGLEYNGSSSAIAPDGTILTENQNEQIVLEVVLMKEELLCIRESLPFLRDF